MISGRVSQSDIAQFDYTVYSKSVSHLMFDFDKVAKKLPLFKTVQHFKSVLHFKSV